MTLEARSLHLFLDELESQCAETIATLKAFKNPLISQDEKEELLGDVSVCITALRIKTELLEQDLDDLEDIVL